MPDRPVVVVARRLLDAGLKPLEERFDVRLGKLDISRPDLLELCRGAQALVADPTVRVDGELLDACGWRLELVANFAVGIDNVDLDACRERGVRVTNTPGVLTSATAELAVTLTLAAARLVSEAERDLREGRWSGWDPAAYRGLELSGATVGIVGLGRIGRRYAELMRGFDPVLLYASPSPRPQAEEALGATRVPLDKLLERADVVSLHAPAAAATRHMIDAAALARMRSTAVLVNTARGSLVDADALAAALERGDIGAAGLDVYEAEPRVPEALLRAPRAVLLPHVGSATGRSRAAMARMVADNVIAVLGGEEPPNAVL